MNISKWKDVTSYSRDDKEWIPRIWELRLNECKVVVHRHIHHPGTWLLTCRELHIERSDLLTDDQNEAFNKVADIIPKKIQQNIDKLQNMMLEFIGSGQ